MTPQPNTAQLARREVLQELQPLRPAGAYTFEELYRLAQVLQSSGMWEDTKDAAQAMVKILKGQEMGLPPTASMSAFDIIQKKIFIKPVAIAAKINACGYGGYRVLSQTADACTIQFTRKYVGRGWVDCPPVTYTYAEAQAHGLVNRSAHWKANPAHMLYQRAMGRGGAMYFPELLAGLTPPPDDTPVSQAQAETNIIDLFGDQAGVQASLEAARHTPSTHGTPALDPQTTGEDTPAWYTMLVQHQGLATGELAIKIGKALADPLAYAGEGEKLAMIVADLAAQQEG